ncbi:hypothetical protein ACFSLT_20175 [Novosphingobium resinovorum]
MLGDQVHLLQTKLAAVSRLDGTPYAISWGNFPGAAPLLEALNAGAVDTAPAGDLPIILAAAAGCKLKIAAVNKGQGDRWRSSCRAVLRCDRWPTLQAGP